MKAKTYLLAASLLTPIVAQAKTVSGVEVSDNLTLNNQTLVLNGAGVRSKFFLDLYVGSLYLPAPSNNLADILAAQSATVRLNITSGMITADKMIDAINEGFEDATHGDLAPIQPQIDQFMALFGDKIIDGDQFTFETSKTAGVTAYKNGVAQATITGEPFREALLKIWLGDKPAQKSLKNKMLGH